MRIRVEMLCLFIVQRSVRTVAAMANPGIWNGRGDFPLPPLLPFSLPFPSLSLPPLRSRPLNTASGSVSIVSSPSRAWGRSPAQIEVVLVWKDYRIGTLHCNWPMSVHASQSFSTYTSSHGCTNSEHLPTKFYAFYTVDTNPDEFMSISDCQCCPAIRASGFCEGLQGFGCRRHY